MWSTRCGRAATRCGSSTLHPAAHAARPDYLDPAAERVLGDVGDGDTVAAALDGVEHVCHQAAMVGGNYKGGFGFHPLLVTCGRETLGAVLRPGNAGANTASDHIDVLELALEALPQSALDGEIPRIWRRCRRSRPGSVRRPRRHCCMAIRRTG